MRISKSTEETTCTFSRKIRQRGTSNKAQVLGILARQRDFLACCYRQGVLASMDKLFIKELLISLSKNGELESTGDNIFDYEIDRRSVEFFCPFHQMGAIKTGISKGLGVISNWPVLTVIFFNYSSAKNKGWRRKRKKDGNCGLLIERLIPKDPSSSQGKRFRHGAFLWKSTLPFADNRQFRKAKTLLEQKASIEHNSFQPRFMQVYLSILFACIGLLWRLIMELAQFLTSVQLFREVSLDKHVGFLERWHGLLDGVFLSEADIVLGSGATNKDRLGSSIDPPHFARGSPGCLCCQSVFELDKGVLAAAHKVLLWVTCCSTTSTSSTRSASTRRQHGVRGANHRGIFRVLFDGCNVDHLDSEWCFPLTHDTYILIASK